MSIETVTVVGGGLAGLSSAVALAEAGFRVQLFEQRPHLGGRATSYDLPDGSHVDNCQHVTLGCCTNLADFYRRVGAGERIRYYDRLYFADAQGRRSTIGLSFLPPPLHMTLSFLCFGSLSVADKRSIARALLHVVRCGGRPPDVEGRSMLDWLHAMKQTPGAIERFWRVVLVSALDEELSRSDAQYGIDVFWKAFLSTRQGFKIGIPDVPLSELYSGCQQAIEKRGGAVRCRASVRKVCVEAAQFQGVVLDDGSTVRSDACILTVPHTALPEMLPPEWVERTSALSDLKRLRTSPITGVHFWFDRPVMKEPFLALLDHTVQWVFNKTVLYGKRNGWPGPKDAPPSGQYLQLVISASYDLVPRPRQEIIDLCRGELASVLPGTRDAVLVKATVVKEIAATFSPEPGSDRWRPGPRTPAGNLFLAGDWTKTGWPATMEGAVRSGYRAAEEVLAAAGRSQRLLVPDLPAEGLCRIWARQSEKSVD